IDEAIIEKIFDPYFSTRDVASGMGLGLYMSKTIVEKHLHGTIKVENIKKKGETSPEREHPGGGVCFTVLLPFEAGK
ncbi:MAG: ATP-binding protein, partial [Campylobacterota bacterium]|nr:ATP-binding protein [Campylobacterota bacterium]